MRVLQLLKTSVGATWALRQMRELVKLGVEVHVALPGAGALIPQYQAAGIVVHQLQTALPIRQPWLIPGLVRDFRLLIDQVKPALVHSHFVATTLTMRLALGKACALPRIFQVPGPLHLEHRVFRTLEILSASQQDYWIGSCEWTRARYLRSGIPSRQLFLSYYGLDLTQFAPQPKGTLRQELGLGNATKIIGMVAYMYAPKKYLGHQRGLKGHEDLIDAVAAYLPSAPDTICVFVGSAWGTAQPYEQQVREYARQRLGSHAIFLGTRHDVAALYADFDVVVHPSHSENVGGAAESLLLGVPTVSTNVGGFPDLIKPGQTGWLVPPQSPGLLKDAIQACLADPHQAALLASAGQALARDLFDVQKTAHHLTQIYDQVLVSQQ